MRGCLTFTVPHILVCRKMPVRILPALSFNLRTVSRAKNLFFFFLNDPAPTNIYPLPLHDALPISFKLASYEMSHLPLARAVLARKKPVFASTGAHTIDEVRPLLEVAREVGNEALVVLQCTAAYPTPPEAVNARAIVTLREATGCLVGLSDHSRNPIIAPVVAVALGACVIEKHFTLSNRLPGPDQKFAVEPAELVRLVRAVRDAEAVL